MPVLPDAGLGAAWHLIRHVERLLRVRLLAVGRLLAVVSSSGWAADVREEPLGCVHDGGAALGAGLGGLGGLGVGGAAGCGGHGGGIGLAGFGGA